MDDERMPEATADVSGRFWRELLELVEQGEISPERARLVQEYALEPGHPDRAPVLKAAAYHADLEDLRRFSGQGCWLVQVQKTVLHCD